MGPKCEGPSHKGSAMHQVLMSILAAVAPGSAAMCPAFDGLRPAANLKAALDWYAGVTEPRSIAAADCAWRQYETSIQSSEAFKAEKSTVNYRYGKFLSEAADLHGRAANRVRQTGGGTGVNYFRREVQIRTTLLGWCLQDATACNVNKELGALAIAYESARQAPEFHDWMISNSPESLAVGAALNIWLRAIASCPAWDFRPPVNGALYDWNQACTPDCREVARDASKVLREHELRLSSLKPQVTAMTAAVEGCPITN